MVPKARPPAPRSRRQRVVRRRRERFVRLLVIAAGTLVLGLIPPLRVFLWAHLLSDIAIAVYVVQLRRWRQAELERRRKVRLLPTERPLPDEVASSGG